MDEVTKTILSMEYTEKEINAIAQLHAKLLLGVTGWTHEQINAALEDAVADILNRRSTVSYTHLTLPTICSV